MSYILSLGVFEGPLDLLLHLIQKQKIDIYNIPVAKVTEQYLTYLKTMQELDLEIASDFILMAATLVAIKAKMLLPKKAEAAGQDDDCCDPRKEIVDRLVEYQRFKNISEEFQLKQARQALLHSRPVDPLQMEAVIAGVNPLENVTLESLKKIFEVVLTEVTDEDEIIAIKKGTVTVKDKVDYIEDLLKKEPEGILFRNIFDKDATNLTIIVTFLALLELIHLSKVFIIQTRNFGPIRIYPKIPRSEEEDVI